MASACAFWTRMCEHQMNPQNRCVLAGSASRGKESGQQSARARAMSQGLAQLHPLPNHHSTPDIRGEKTPPVGSDFADLHHPRRLLAKYPTTTPGRGPRPWEKPCTKPAGCICYSAWSEPALVPVDEEHKELLDDGEGEEEEVEGEREAEPCGRRGHGSQCSMFTRLPVLNYQPPPIPAPQLPPTFICGGGGEVGNSVYSKLIKSIGTNSGNKKTTIVMFPKKITHRNNPELCFQHRNWATTPSPPGGHIPDRSHYSQK